MEIIEEKFRIFFLKEKCKSCNSELKVEKCKEFDECSGFERDYFFAGYNQHKKDIIESVENVLNM